MQEKAEPASCRTISQHEDSIALALPYGGPKSAELYATTTTITTTDNNNNNNNNNKWID